jgi:hypothetical protein
MLAQHSQDTHADTAKGRVIAFMIDGLLLMPETMDGIARP